MPKKMTATELRIGNWYNCANPMEGGKLYPNQFTAWTEYLDFEAYGEPIPLSPEILEKCGFESEDDDYWYHPDTMIFELTQKFPGSGYWWAVRRTSLPAHLVIKERFCYLHQLQNLYQSLTNQELIYTP